MSSRWTPPPTFTLEECRKGFEYTLEHSSYGERTARWPAYVNEDILAAFGEDDVLGGDAFVPRYDARMAAKFKSYKTRPAPDKRAWENAGNALGWGVRLGLLTMETSTDGERRWRLVRRVPTFALDKKWRCEQVAGLAPEAQAERDKKAATNAKLTTTLAKKACVKAIPSLAGRLRRILEAEPGFLVPQDWAEQGYAPEWTGGCALSVCFDDIRDAPLVGQFSKPQLTAWGDLLTMEGHRARVRAYERRKAAEAEARAADLAAALEAVDPPDEDLAALDIA